MGVTLRLEAVRAGYGGREVLHDIDLRVTGGEILALIGPNGSGKTTLLRVMCRVIKPAAGRVAMDGEDIGRFHETEFARRVARVPQTSELAWPLTVQQVVELGRFPHTGWFSAYGPDDQRVVNEALLATGLWELRGRPVTSISGGERQRAMIARSLAQTPAILVLDEPVAHLDLSYQVAILDLLRTLAAEGLGVIVSMHDLNLAALYADRVALLSQGRLAGLGNPADIIRKDVIEEVYGVEVSVERHPRHGLPAVIPCPRWLRNTGER